MRPYVAQKPILHGWLSYDAIKNEVLPPSSTDLSLINIQSNSPLKEIIHSPKCTTQMHSITETLLYKKLKPQMRLLNFCATFKTVSTTQEGQATTGDSIIQEFLKQHKSFWRICTQILDTT